MLPSRTVKLQVSRIKRPMEQAVRSEFRAGVMRWRIPLRPGIVAIPIPRGTNGRPVFLLRPNVPAAGSASFSASSGTTGTRRWLTLDTLRNAEIAGRKQGLTRFAGLSYRPAHLDCGFPRSHLPSPSLLSLGFFTRRNERLLRNLTPAQPVQFHRTVEFTIPPRSPVRGDLRRFSNVSSRHDVCCADARDFFERVLPARPWMPRRRLLRSLRRVLWKSLRQPVQPVPVWRLRSCSTWLRIPGHWHVWPADAAGRTAASPDLRQHALPRFPSTAVGHDRRPAVVLNFGQRIILCRPRQPLRA